MRKLFASEKYLRLQARKSKKALKRRKKTKARINKIHKNKQGKPKIRHRGINPGVSFNYLMAPKIFSLLENTEETIGFINKIEAFSKKRLPVFVMLKDVKSVDYSAITVLLSVMHNIKIKGIPFNGNHPEDLAVKKKIEDSQFFERLYKPLSSESYTLKKHNQIFATTNHEVVSSIGLNITEEASRTVWGEKRKCTGLQRTLIELMQNTHNHASFNEENEKPWWLSVNHDKVNNKVHFHFVDYGQGILKSVERRSNPNLWDTFMDTAKKMLDLGNGHEIIKLLFAGGQWPPFERNQPYYRGKGLPGIANALKRNQISNLQIITNNTYSDISKNNYSKISKDFNGTFVHWELEPKNISSKWNL